MHKMIDFGKPVRAYLGALESPRRCTPGRVWKSTSRPGGMEVVPGVGRYGDLRRGLEGMEFCAAAHTVRKDVSALARCGNLRK